jgi:hypothetical protein
LCLEPSYDNWGVPSLWRGCEQNNRSIKMSEFDDYEIKLLNMTEEEMDKIANGEDETS